MATLDKEKRPQQAFDWESDDLKGAVIQFSGIRTAANQKTMTLKSAINHLIKKGLEAEGFKSVA